MKQQEVHSEVEEKVFRKDLLMTEHRQAFEQLRSSPRQRGLGVAVVEEVVVSEAEANAEARASSV